MENFSLPEYPNISNSGHNLIVLKKFSEYYRYFYQIYKIFPKIDKYSIGKKILDENLEIYISIFKISKLKQQDANKKLLLIETNEKLDIIRFLIRNLSEMKIIKPKQYYILFEQLLEIGKMIGGLIKSQSTNKDQ